MEEKKNWKERLGGYDSMEEAMFVTIDEKTVYAIDELKEFIQQELDRARKEGRQESWKECEEFYGDMREILRPYHMEAEDYRTTLKRLLKLKTKIGKLKPFHIIIEKGSEQIAKELINASDKINEIIDYLNTQPQTEEKECECCKWDDMGYTHEPYCPLFKEYKQDTPEQKEEWEKKWEEFFLYVTNNKNWVDGRPEWKGNVYITLYNAMKDFIRQLLEEGERWAIDTFLKDTASYNSFHNGRPRTMRNGLSGEGFEVRVSKLNK